MAGQASANGTLRPEVISCKCINENSVESRRDTKNSVRVYVRVCGVYFPRRDVHSISVIHGASGVGLVRLSEKGRVEKSGPGVAMVVVVVVGGPG